jgi:putative endonuclease
MGQLTEAAAARFLEQRGMLILKMNYRTRRGEIDIIARDGDCLVFVEVKSQSARSAWPISERIGRRKRSRLILAAQEYLSTGEVPLGGARFDAVLMTRKSQDEWRIEHLRDAFWAEDNPTP